MRLSLAIPGVAFLMAACGSNSISNLDHTFGKTSRAPKTALEACTPESPSDDVLRTAQAYITNIARQIMKSNQQTFSGTYAPEKFCFRVQRGDQVNAYAEPTKGAITFYTGMLEVLHSDASVAAVMSHELAHVTMQHTGDEKDEVENDARWQASGPALKQQNAQLASDYSDIQDRQSEYENVYRQYDDALNNVEAAATKSLREALDERFYALNEQINRAATNAKTGFDSYAVLADKLKPTTPRYSVEFMSMTTTPLETEAYRSLLAQVETYNADRDAWLLAEAAAAPDLTQQYRDFIVTYQSMLDKGAVIYQQMQDNAAKLEALRKEILGDVAANWQEEEADDVGLELFLRAGFAPIGFQELFDALSRNQQADAAACAVQNEASLPMRGDDSHPSACWRFYNAKVLEMSQHAADYAQFLPTATAVEVLPGQLESLKKSIAASRPQQPY